MFFLKSSSTPTKHVKKRPRIEEQQQQDADDDLARVHNLREEACKAKEAFEVSNHISHMLKLLHILFIKKIFRRKMHSYWHYVQKSKKIQQCVQYTIQYWN